MAAVCAGNSLSRPGTFTGTNLPVSSTCGGRPGENSKSLTLSEARNIWRRMVMKSSGGGLFAGLPAVADAGGGAVLMISLETFRRLPVSKDW